MDLLELNSSLRDNRLFWDQKGKISTDSQTGIWRMVILKPDNSVNSQVMYSSQDMTSSTLQMLKDNSNIHIDEIDSNLINDDIFILQIIQTQISIV